jgi:hypothetical protein
MNISKTLMLAAVTALSLGAGSAMAQESAGGVNAGPYETSELQQMYARYATARPAQTSAVEVQSGSSDGIATSNPLPTLEGGGG